MTDWRQANPGLGSYLDSDALAKALEDLAVYGQRAAAQVCPAMTLVAEKMAMHLEVPEELLMDYGVIEDTREHKPMPWRQRLRWWLSDWRESLAAAVYRVIAGHSIPDPYDD